MWRNPSANGDAFDLCFAAVCHNIVVVPLSLFPVSAEGKYARVETLHGRCQAIGEKA